MRLILLTLLALTTVGDLQAGLLRGHVPGGMGDFQFLPPGSSAAAAGCGALDPSWGFRSCAMFESWRYAGAAMVMGSDGRLYSHLFVR